MNRKFSFAMAAWLMVASVHLFAAGEQEATAVDPDEPVIINVLTPAGGGGEPLVLAISMFNKEFEGKYKAVPSIWGNSVEIYDKGLRQFMSGNAVFDVVPITSLWPATYGPFVEPLDDYIDKFGPTGIKDIVTGLDGVFNYDGKIIGLPYRLGVIIMAYRKDLLAEKGLSVPRTYDEFKAAAEALAEGPPGDRTRWGSVFRMTSHRDTTQMLSDWLIMPGGRYLTDDMSAVSDSLTSDYAVGRLEFMKSFIDDGLVPNPLGTNIFDIFQLMQQGQVGILPFQNSHIGRIEDPEVSATSGKWGYAPMPVEQLGPAHASVNINGWSLGIDKNSDKKEAAYELIKYVSTNFDAQLKMAIESFNGPPHLAVMASQEFNAFNPGGKASGDALAMLPGRNTTPIFSGTEQLSIINHEEVQAFLLDRQDARTTLQNIARRLDDLLE
jgi:ABC-type glycerol-3-phosphate transport system substrate-binding protein